MIEVYEIIKEIENTSGRIDKENILKANKDNKLLQKVLEYTYNPYKIYGMGKKSLEDVGKYSTTDTTNTFNAVFHMLDFLNVNNLNNDIKKDVIDFINIHNESERELYSQMILKDLRLGMSAKTINKVYKGLIPTFDLMLAKKYDDRADKIIDEEIIISTKLDGIRLAIVKDNGGIKFMTRQGKELEGLIDIEEEISTLPNGVYDGELLALNCNNLDSKDLFAVTRKETSKKGLKKNLVFHVFDYIPCDEFKSGVSQLGCRDRKRQIVNILKDDSLQWVKGVETLMITSDHSKVKYWLDKAIQNGEEGIMVNLDKPYECKRSNTLLKVKQFYTFDGEIVSIYEGEGRNKGKLGGIVITYKDLQVKCGSGFTDEERELYFNQPDTIIGKIGECKYFEESENQKGGKDLRFCTWERLRNDKVKGDESYE